MIKDNADSGVVLDAADGNLVASNEATNNGTAGGDATDGIRVTLESSGNMIQQNQLRNNVTHDCHDDSAGGGTAGTANVWLDNHGGAENRPGLCSGNADEASLEATTAFGWNPAFPWYESFGAAADYDWVSAYAGIDTDTLLQMLPSIRVSSRGRIPVSPQP